MIKNSIKESILYDLKCFILYLCNRLLDIYFEIKNTKENSIKVFSLQLRKIFFVCLKVNVTAHKI